MSARIFLLSPAHCGGERARLVLRPEATFDLACRLRTRPGASLGEVFSFLSGLYFRGKLAYAPSFARPPDGMRRRHGDHPVPGAPVPGRPRGRAPDAAVRAGGHRRGRRSVPRGPWCATPGHCSPSLAGRGDCEVVLLGSVASDKYVEPSRRCSATACCFRVEFVGRGDMSRGGLLLRCVTRAGSSTMCRCGTRLGAAVGRRDWSRSPGSCSAPSAEVPGRPLDDLRLSLGLGDVPPGVSGADAGSVPRVSSGEETARAILSAPSEVDPSASSRRDTRDPGRRAHRPALGHRDAALGRDASGHGRRPRRQRRVRRGPDDEPPPGADGRAPREGGGALAAERDDGQPGRPAGARRVPATTSS